MYSEETIEVNVEERCRICLEGKGQIITPCQCRGSVKYIHENCLNLWISKALDMKRMKSVHKGGNKYSVKCELCKGDINFKMEKHLGCKSCDEVKMNIHD